MIISPKNPVDPSQSNSFFFFFSGEKIPSEKKLGMDQWILGAQSIHQTCFFSGRASCGRKNRKVWVISLCLFNVCW